MARLPDSHEFPIASTPLLSSPSSTDSTGFIYPRKPLPPPAEWHWIPPAPPVHSFSFPSLPLVETEALARQARMTEDFLLPDWAKHSFAVDAIEGEMTLNRTLEWVGGTYLRQAQSAELSRLLPEFDENVVSVSSDFCDFSELRACRRSQLTLSTQMLGRQLQTNATLSFIACSFPVYSTDPISHSQTVVAGLFRPHLGALIREERQAAVNDWIKEFLEENGNELKKMAEALSAAVNTKSSGAEGKEEKDFETKKSDQRRAAILLLIDAAEEANNLAVVELLCLAMWSDVKDQRESKFHRIPAFETADLFLDVTDRLVSEATAILAQLGNTLQSC
jgi:hypothetical protein